MYDQEKVCASDLIATLSHPELPVPPNVQASETLCSSMRIPTKRMSRGSHGSCVTTPQANSLMCYSVVIQDRNDRMFEGWVPRPRGF